MTIKESVLEGHDVHKFIDYFADIKALHNKIVMAIKLLMFAHDTAVVDLLGNDLDHAYITGYPGDGADVMEMQVSKAYLVNGELMIDVIIDDTNQCWQANDFTHFKPCAGIEMVYKNVYQLLENQSPNNTTMAKQKFGTHDIGLIDLDEFKNLKPKDIMEKLKEVEKLEWQEPNSELSPDR